MNKILTIYLLSLFCVGCIHKEQHFDEHKFIVQSDAQYELQIKSGIVTPLDTLSNGDLLYSVTFAAVEGGESKLFGLWTISDGNAYSAKRLNLLHPEQEMLGLSINDLLESGNDTILLNNSMLDLQ